MEEDYEIKTCKLTKVYKKKAVVKGIDMHIKKGAIYGLIGQNGAGKTTVLKMLAGLVKPTEGEIEVFGHQHLKKKVYRRMGSMIHLPTFYTNLTAIENLNIHRKMIGITNKEYIAEALDKVGLEKQYWDAPIKKYSRGLKQRLGIARAILHKPELIVLDEPINGLDPNGIQLIQQLLVDLCSRKNITILLTSHTLNRLESIVTTIGVLHKGVLLEEIQYEDLRRKSRKCLNIKVSNDTRACYILENKIGIYSYQVVEKNKLIIYEGLDRASEIVRMLIIHNIDVIEIYESSYRLEDYFLEITGGNKDV
ncbi:ATP-binding cassette domain-containing protein [Vallitalea okinawensis]|uniref:ATP-binding cassette domain-containing protein n=1 Tax=Vallitalea okinawensis TaxID=2078660 RepID=UPI001FA88519|nr:ABC transporter ATP-binding protein [Vallitalea okinawensis]